jgi:hypothetical protein
VLSFLAWICSFCDNFSGNFTPKRPEKPVSWPGNAVPADKHKKKSRFLFFLVDVGLQM